MDVCKRTDSRVEPISIAIVTGQRNVESNPAEVRGIEKNDGSTGEFFADLPGLKELIAISALYAFSRHTRDDGKIGGR